MAQKKRHHHAAKHSSGMNNERAYVSSYDEARRRALEDSGMIAEDRRAIANLPQGSYVRSWPETKAFHYSLDDTIRGVDVQMDDDVMKERRKSNSSYPEKW
jgi:hypothetical protein